MGPGEYEQMLHDAEVRLARLKSLYEQYFQGIEKLEPAIPRKDLERLLDLLRKSQPRNTALRFRTQMLIAKYGTYVTYWQRIARQIEEGTYRRDVVRAQQRRAREQARGRNDARENEGPSAWEIDVDVDEVEDLKDFSFDESDVDAILGTLGGAGAPSKAGPSTDPSPAPSIAPPRRLSVFGSTVPSRTSALPPAAVPPAARVPQGTTPAAAPPQQGGPRVAATFSKPTATATFGKPATATFAKPPGPAPSPAAPRPAPDTSGARPPAAAPAASAPRPPVSSPARPAPAPAARPTSNVDDAEMRRIYDRYVEARRRNNERVDNVRYETLAQSVQQMIPKLREKHGDRKIDFDVVVQNGKVGLKPKVG